VIPELNLQKRSIGLNFTSEGEAVFFLWGPLLDKVELIVNESFVLNPARNVYGYWGIATDRIKPGDRYSIRINDSDILPDPASLFQSEGVHGPSRAFDLNSFMWQDNEWAGIRSQDLIFYELHTGTFTSEGTFKGIESRIGYLKELGITAIEIMPVAQFPGGRNWGYDGVYPFAVQDSYGGPEALQHLVNTFHKNGIAVILDVVFNHLGPEGNYLNQFGPYFTDKYKTPWGMAINFDDAWCDGVRRFYVENMLMWFRDFHIDALRLDAVHAIKDFSTRHIIQELHETAARLEEMTGRKNLLTGENDLNDNKYIRSVKKCGYGLDMQWCDEFHHSLHALVTGEKQGYYSDFGNTWQVVKAFNSAYVYDGIYSSHRKKIFGSKTAEFPGNKFIVFIQNHDHIGNRMMGDRLSNLTGFEELKLLAGAMFVSPFVPLLFMGEEYAATNPFFYFTSHSDEKLIELVRKGRVEEFSDFIESEKVPDPDSREVFKKSILDFSISGNKEYMLAFYKELISLKKNHPVWKDYDRTNNSAVEEGTRTVTFSKRSGSNHLFAVMNFDKEPKNINIPAVDWKDTILLIDSADKKWGGPKDKDSAGFKNNEILVYPSSIIILSDIPA
jgi:maltooligosyltrehalose trehalohydrolase